MSLSSLLTPESVVTLHNPPRCVSTPTSNEESTCCGTTIPHHLYCLCTTFSSSLPFVSQIRATHIAGTPAPLPTTVRAFRFFFLSRAVFFTFLPSSTRVESCLYIHTLHTYQALSLQSIFLSNKKKKITAVIRRMVRYVKSTVARFLFHSKNIS